MPDKEEVFVVNGYRAVIMQPENANGKWIWKTEFFHAFEAAEEALYRAGYTRVYYEISDKYGSPEAVRLMYDFYKVLRERIKLDEKGILFGFSRGGLYAFNFALKHPECVGKVYLDAPVLDLRSWPRTDPVYGEVELHEQVMKEYGFETETEFLNYTAYPVEKLKEYFENGIPTLLIAGDDDRTVDFRRNSEIMIRYCEQNGISLVYYVKAGVDHHPHSFGNLKDPWKGGREYPETFKVYSSSEVGSSRYNPVVIKSDVSIVTNFVKTG